MSIYFKDNEVAPIYLDNVKLRKLVDRSITTITAEDLAGVTSIGRSAFAYCSSLTGVTIPGSVTRIGEQAFDASYHQGNIATVNFSKNSTLQSIGDYAFRYQWKLQKFICPASVTSMNGRAFYGCDIVKLIMLPTAPPTIGAAFSNDPKTIYVPYASMTNYSTMTNWTAVTARMFPLVNTISDLASIDTTTYTKACVIGTDESYKEYTYDGSQWSEVI